MVHEKELRELIREETQASLSHLGPDDDLRLALDLDSLDTLDLLATIEERYGVHFADEDISRLTTLRRIESAVREKQLCVSA